MPNSLDRKLGTTSNSAKTTAVAKAKTAEYLRKNQNQQTTQPVINQIVDGLTKGVNTIMDYQRDQADKVNAANMSAAQWATYMSMAEADRNRAWQEQMWEKTAAYNSAEAQANRAWQTEMSNTSYRRAMEDMKAAGLNPILAYSQGGAANGTGATATIGSMTSGLGSAFSYDAQQANLGVGNIISAGLLGATSLGSSAIETLGNVVEGIFDLLSGLKKKRKIGF